MFNTTNYSIPFHQSNLLSYVEENKDVMNKLGNQLKSITNISEVCQGGTCYGLAHTFAAYELHGLGAESINQLNNCLQPVSLTKSPYEQIEKYTQKSFKECISKVLASRCTDIFNIQINQMPQHFYKYMAVKVDSLKLPDKPQDIENLEYIMRCLDNNKHEVKRSDSYNIEYETERKVIYDFYKTIELGLESSFPEIFKVDPIIYKKIQDKVSLTESEIKLFLKYAYHYCRLHYSYETAIFNSDIGITYSNKVSSLSYNNIIYNKTLDVTLQQIENHLSTIEDNKITSALLFLTNCHAMTISGRYDEQKKQYIFSFFEPNKGLLQTNDKTQIIDLIKEITAGYFIPPLTFTANFPFIERTLISQAIGSVIYLEKRNELSKKPYLPSINKKEIQILTKKHLAEDKVDMTLYNGAKLKFVDYDPKNDKIKLELMTKTKNYTLYSEFNDVNTTISLINASMDEYQKHKSKDIYIDGYASNYIYIDGYASNDIYIDKKGQILNRLKTA